MHPEGSKSQLSHNGSTTDDQGLPIPHKLMHPEGSKSRLSHNGSTTNIAPPPNQSTQPAQQRRLPSSAAAVPAAPPSQQRRRISCPTLFPVEPVEAKLAQGGRRSCPRPKTGAGRCGGDGSTVRLSAHALVRPFAFRSLHRLADEAGPPPPSPGVEAVALRQGDVPNGTVVLSFTPRRPPLAPRRARCTGAGPAAAAPGGGQGRAMGLHGSAVAAGARHRRRSGDGVHARASPRASPSPTCRPPTRRPCWRGPSRPSSSLWSARSSKRWPCAPAWARPSPDPAAAEHHPDRALQAPAHRAGLL
jgi:hypothetical protein